MSRFLSGLNQKDGNLIYPPPTSPSPPLPSSSSSISIISPVILLVIVIVAAIFFICGIVHLLLRFLIKRSSSSIFQSNRYPETSGSRAIQRQLQQLFRLHDSGLDQSTIDSLPVFFCKDIVGLKGEPFDCAVCLCEFSDQDKLRLLPICGHAFHIDCIDTWLLSNSTCPLCRGTLSGFSTVLENPVFNYEECREMSSRFLCDEDNKSSSAQKKDLSMDEAIGEKRVFSVRLGKFKISNGGENGERLGETSSCNLDARRCYSMGAYQYVVGDSNLQLAFSHDSDAIAKLVKEGVHRENLEGKKINGRQKGESFSVSKIWLWSSKNKLPGSSHAHTSGVPPSRASSINNET